MTKPPPDRTPVLAFVRERWMALVLTIVTITFVVQNRERAQINLFWMHVRMPLWLVLIAITVIGVAIGYLAAHRRHRRR